MLGITSTVLYLDEQDVIPKYLRTVKTIKDTHILLSSLKTEAKVEMKNYGVVIFKLNSKDERLIKSRY